MTEIWIDVVTLTDLVDESFWVKLLPKLENCVGAKLSKLDTNDPVKRLALSNRENAKYICDFPAKYINRTIHCRFENSNIEATISLYKEPVKTERKFTNNITFYFPESYLDSSKGINTLISLFSILNDYLNPFYSYCDVDDQISAKRKATGWPINLEAELVGMFWLTFLHSKYTEFFGLDSVSQLDRYVIRRLSNGQEFQIGEKPNSGQSIELRTRAQKVLGEDSFVNPKSEFDKPPGINMLLFSQLC